MVQFGNMSPLGLTTNLLISHAERYHAETEVISVDVNGNKIRSNWHEVGKQSRKLASSLEILGVESGDVVGTICSNTKDHIEILYAISGCGAIAHTINPRLFPDEIVYIINNAKDKILFIDTAFLPFLIGHKHLIVGVEHFYIVGPKTNEIAAKMNGLKFLSDLRDEGNSNYNWPEIDDRNAAALCFTSGTTGKPKGVLYSHKSIVTHANMISLPDYFSFSALDSLMPVTPMFHVNAWGATYASSMVGCRLILPGPNVNAVNLIKLINEEKVTVSIGIPTIWDEILSYLKKTGKRLNYIERIYAGGAKVPEWMISAYESEHKVKLIQAWGMTELSPLGLINSPKNNTKANNSAPSKLSTGRPVWAVDFKLIGDKSETIPHDGKSIGNIYVKGPTVIHNYLNHTESATDDDGWFKTGDIGHIDSDGFITLTDRSKDLIKSGGEWISSLHLEMIVCQHPKIHDAAVVGVLHSKWGERPIVIAEPKSNKNPSEEEILSHFENKIVKWQIPDKVVFVDELPLSSTGKPLKKDLKRKFFNILTKGD